MGPPLIYHSCSTQAASLRCNLGTDSDIINIKYKLSYIWLYLDEFDEEDECHAECSAEPKEEVEREYANVLVADSRGLASCENSRQIADKRSQYYENI